MYTLQTARVYLRNRWAYYQVQYQKPTLLFEELLQDGIDREITA